jgi:ankyrin repeat protein
VKVLLDKDAGIESKNKHGKTALSLAAEQGNWAIVRLLLNTGAGQTPLLRAAKSGHEAAVNLFLDKDANVE